MSSYLDSFLQHVQGLLVQEACQLKLMASRAHHHILQQYPHASSCPAPHALQLQNICDIVLRITDGQSRQQRMQMSMPQALQQRYRVRIGRMKRTW